MRYAGNQKDEDNMVQRINRKELVKLHNPVLEEVNTKAPLTVGNGEIAFTADITGMQTLYEEYNIVPLCTMSQWGWHTKPVSEKKYAYTLENLEMTKYRSNERILQYPVNKIKGNEEVYDWLRQNPHRLNLMRLGLIKKNGQRIRKSEITSCRQELDLYEGILDSRFCLKEMEYHTLTACDNQGKDEFAFIVRGDSLVQDELAVEVDFPYGAADITGSDWNSAEKHQTQIVLQKDGELLLDRILDRDKYQVRILANGTFCVSLQEHCVQIIPKENELRITVAFCKKEDNAGKEPERESAEQILTNSRTGWKSFWENGGIVRLNQSKDKRAFELERRIILSQYLMAVNSSGSMPPQETGLVCNSWYGKMHLEMYLWHCAWLPLWGHNELLERSLNWYLEHIEQARENATRNGYKGARWPKMIAEEGIDSPSNIAPLLVWQQPHIIYMLEMAYRAQPCQELLQKYWILIKETADFMVDFVVWNSQRNCYEICEPVIPVQECHRPEETVNPAFEVEYWSVTLKIAQKWAERLGEEEQTKWNKVAEGMAPLPVKGDCYLAHDNCPDTFTQYNKDHPSMLGALGLISGEKANPEIMRKTLHKVIECWDYQTLWGWDFALMAMTAVRLGERELAIDLLLKDTPKNSYLENGQNMQLGRRDLPLYLPGNGSLLLTIPLMTAGWQGASEKNPGFPKDGSWIVEAEGITEFPV